jgi:thiol-disulfide isomerase/thioredoxin
MNAPANLHRRRLLAATLLSAVACRSTAEGRWKPWTGPSAAPPIDLFTASGAGFSLSGLRGRVVLVNFWATWCEPCVTEMPSLEQLRARLAPRLEVVGVNYQEGAARINAFIQRAAIAFPIVRDTDGAVAKAWGARIFPSSYLVDRAGDVRFVLVGGADWTSEALLDTIRPLL